MTSQQLFSSRFKQRPKILVIGPSWVGDMVMANTLFQILNARTPAPDLDVLAPEFTRPLLSRMPEVRRAISLPVGHGELALKKRYEIGKMLRRHRYDQVIVLPNSFKSALVPWFARIPVRTGFRGEMRYGLLNDVHLLDQQRYPLMVERYAALGFAPNALLPKLPSPHLIVDGNAALHATQAHNIDYHAERPIVALCPGAEFGPSKRWPSGHFAKVAAYYAEKGYQIWLFGSKKDQEVTTEIQAACGQVCVDLAGKTTLSEAIDLLSLSTVVVSNDSGLMHIAAALSKPLVAVYGSTTPKFTPPLEPNAQIVRLENLPCSPCFKRECPLQHHACMNELLPEMVIAKIEERLAA